MSAIGNILWFLFGGLIGGLSWVLAGLIFCVTIVGIPVGMQCFKMAQLAFSRLGKKSFMAAAGFRFWSISSGFCFSVGRWRLAMRCSGWFGA